jgi:hypothetical protein
LPKSNFCHFFDFVVPQIKKSVSLQQIQTNMKAWSKTTVSRELYESIQKDGKLDDFEQNIRRDLTKVLFQQIPKDITLPKDWENKVDFYRDQEDDGSMTYRALLYIPENSPTKLVR